MRWLRPSLAGAESFGLGLAMLALLGVTAVGLSRSQFWKPDLQPHAPWCHVGEGPTYHFGFAALSEALGPTMGDPIECEHGDESTVNTLQKTTTGLAFYYGCTNAPTFSRGDEHWMLTPEGMDHWTGDATPPRALPLVRGRDLRHPCPG